MILRSLVGLALVGFVAVGCQTKAKTSATEPAPLTDQQVLEQVRQAYQNVDPHARVGLVTAVLSSDQLLAVGDIDLNGFAAGSYIAVVDRQQNAVANGQVIVVTKDSLHVRYDAASAVRAPQVGDLAVAATLPR